MTADKADLRFRTLLLLGVLPALLGGNALAAWWMAGLGMPLPLVVIPTAVSLVATFALTSWLDRRLALGVAALEGEAMRIAVGAAPDGTSDAPVELREVSESLALTESSFVRRMSELAGANETLETTARARDLLAILAREQPGNPSENIHAEWLNGDPGYADGSGFLIAPGGRHLIGWIADGARGDALDLLRLRREVELVCRRILERHAAAPGTVLTLTTLLYQPEIGAFLLIDGARCRLDAVVRRPLTLLHGHPGGDGAAVQLTASRSLDIPEGGFALICSGDPVRAAASSPALRAHLGARLPPPSEPPPGGLLMGLVPRAAPMAGLPFPVGLR